MKQKIKALGIMNGTSLDAIDYALIEADASFKNLRFSGHRQMKIPKNLKERLLLAASNQASTYELSALHFDLGRLYGQQIDRLKKAWTWDIAGLHGQTVHHQGKVATLQVGHPGFIKESAGKPVYFDFRAADLIAGGQGAPFAPFFQKVLSRNLKLKNVAFHNLGGISNLAHFSPKSLFAFDTGPANILLDTWIKEKKGQDYDHKGRLAAQGIPDPLLVNEFFKHPFFKLGPPKSTGREDFNLQFIKNWGGQKFMKLNLNDQLATLTELTALSLAQSYLQLPTPPPARIYFYGGGVYNEYLMQRIKFNLPGVEIKQTDELGWPSQAMESATFAFLAAARHFHKKVHVPHVTGANKVFHLGSLYF